MDATPPRNAVLYCRISDARNGDARGVRDQEADLRDHAAKLGWGISRVIVENDTSAFKRRKVELPDGSRAMRVVRPGWRQMLDDLAAGRADGLLALDLDRVARDPRDLEDLIDVVESRTPRIPVESVTGSLRLANDSDVTMARVQIAIANKSSRDTSRRVKRARLRQAMDGQIGGGGRRPFGFDEDRVTVRPSEAAEIVDAADALLAGVSLRQVTASLRARGVPTVTGAPWTTRSLRDILVRPRNAGLMVYQGDALEGSEAPWDPILSRDVWDAVRALLTDPSRRTSPGNVPRWLGSGIYRCGHPDCVDRNPPITMRVGTSGSHRHRQPAYGCRRTPHLTRAAHTLDKFVSHVIIARLERRDAVHLLTAGHTDMDTALLAREVNAVRTRIAEAGDLWEDGTLSAAEYRERKARLEDTLTKLEAEQRAATGRDPLAGIAGRADAAKVWERLDLGRQRAILDSLIVVTVLPQRPGRLPDGSRFDPEAVDIRPRRP